jgi:putative ABC transport system permease protein
MFGDVRLAFRQIRRAPAVSSTAIMALAIGIAVNTVAFSAVNAFLFKPRAGWDIEGAGRIEVTGVGSSEEGLALPEYERLTDATKGALVPAAQGRAALAWQRPGATETVWALVVSASYFDILEETALTGRLFAPGDTAAVAVVSERFWRDRLGSGNLAGQTLTLNGVDTPIIGVVPDSHNGPGGLYAPQVWIPLEARRAYGLTGKYDDERTLWLSMVGRLVDGTSVAEVNVRLAAGTAAIAHEWPATHAQRTARFAPLSEWVPEVAAVARASVVGMAAVAIVLLIACFNVATLLLARGLSREREMGIRAAVGATRWRLVRQQLVEGVVLSGLAGICASILATWSQSLLSVFAIPIAMPQRLDVTPDLRVAAFIALMVVAAGVLPCIAPALKAARVNLLRALSAQGAAGTGGRPTGARRTLVVLQVAGSTGFLILTALFVQGFIGTQRFDPGFEDERALVIAIDPSSDRSSGRRAPETIDRITTAIAAMPGVAAVGIADRIPFYIGFTRSIEVANAGSPCAHGGCPRIAAYSIAPGFFDAMDVPILRGRDLTAADANGVIVNEAFAQAWFQGASGLGELVRLGPESEPRVVVGVARTTLQRGFNEPPTPVVYLPITQAQFAEPLTIVARTVGDPAPLVRAASDTLYRVAPSLAAESVMTMSGRLEMVRWPLRSASVFFGVCGVLALVLATIGLAAVMAHAVGQRKREFGVRLAIGASGGQLLRGVLASGLHLAGMGALAGIVAALALSRLAGGTIVGVSLNSPLTYAGVAALQAVVALAACLLPALRAARVDPVKALRGE